MSTQIVSWRRGPTIQGAYLSGTCTWGSWMVWSPGNTFSNAKWYVQKSPAGNLDWMSGYYLFAGVVPHQNNVINDLITGQPITLVSDGYHPGALILASFASGQAGYPLTLGSTYPGTTEAGHADMALLDGSQEVVGATLESVTSIGSAVKAKVFIKP